MNNIDKSGRTLKLEELENYSKSRRNSTAIKEEEIGLEVRRSIENETYKDAESYKNHRIQTENMNEGDRSLGRMKQKPGSFTISKEEGEKFAVIPKILGPKFSLDALI